jgi:glycosyltransferase involved in cell wall biosynthesis
MDPASRAAAEPELSLVMPCYDEEAAIRHTIPRLVAAFAQRGHRLELVACDNGSRDRTGAIIAELAAAGLPVVPHRVEVNRGYGHGILSALPSCRAPWIGFIAADGQVDAEDAVRLWEAVRHTDPPALAKVRRRFRMDGLVRKVVSIAYNGFVRFLWPRLRSIDINGVPKILHRDTLRALRLESQDFFLDPELMIKAHALGVRVIEMNVFARMRSAGRSHIRARTCLQFFVNLLRFRCGGLLRWRRSLAPSAAGTTEPPRR